MEYVEFELVAQPREGQHEKLVGKARIVDDYKNHDEFDTWGGYIVGPRDDVIASLMAMGVYQFTPVKMNLTKEEIVEMLDTEATERDGQEEE